MKRKIHKLAQSTFCLLVAIFISERTFAQVPTCGINVPFYSVNLTGHPDSIWYSPGHSRVGNCCGTSSPNNCTSFQITLDTGAAMINFNIASGAMPSGAMFYQINCGPPVAVGQPICLTGPGPFNLTFCKPGNNQNTYMVQSIPKPTFPKPQIVRIGCNKSIKVIGLDSTTVTWTSVFPGTIGQYNSYLSCTSGCANPVYTPATNAPSYIIYKICGTPLATTCGFVATCDTFRITNAPPLTATVTPNPAVFCTGGSGVLLSVAASGGYGAYTYIWRDQSSAIVGTASTYNATSAGIFSVEIRDALYTTSNCPSIFVSVPVTVTSVPIVNAGPDQTLCTTSPTAYLTGTVQYAPGGIWSGGAGTFNPNDTNLLASYTPTASEIASGSVTLTLTTTGVGGGCTNATDVVVIYYPAKLIVTLPTINLPCNNSSTILTPTVTGGTAPFSYYWNTGSNNTSITVAQGNYCVSVTDNIGCNDIKCTNVIAPPALNLSMASTNITVNGGSDGTATASPGGGTPPYTYSWSNGQSTQTATGLSYGIYTVIISDSKGCTISGSIVVNEPRCASFGASMTKNNVLCFGNSNGSATVNVLGGTGPYTYNWNDPLSQTTATASNLGAGTYMVIVRDSNKCLFAASVIINQPTQLFNVMNQTNVTTFSGNNGSATANPFNGTPGYTYNWSNGGTTQTISSLTPGTYILNLRDSNNCSLIDSVKILGASCQNLAVAFNINDVSCFGGNNGSATVVPLHGAAPYSYLWNTGATTPTINNLTPGSYVVTVTDALNCTLFRNITISEPSPLSIALAPAPITCFAKNDGTIELSISGGVFPYSFSWSNGITVEDLINLSNGTYSVIATDANGCVTTGSATIVSPSPLTVANTSTNVTCYGGNNGAININVGGGSIPYSYAWNNGSTSQNISGLTSGQYSVVVTDANGCSVTTPLGILIDQPDTVALLSYSVSCPAPGSGVALVSVTPSGGWLSPYQISYDNGTTYQSAGTYTILLPVNGTYTVMVKDVNNCASPVPAIITINPETSVSAINFSKCYYGLTTTTQVTVTPSGGTGGPYSISIDGGTTYLPSGTYTVNVPIDSNYSVIVKDGNSCTSLASAITLPSVLASTSNTLTYNGYNISCNGLSDGSITLATTGGVMPYGYSWSNASSSQNQSGLSAGTYSVIISDANNCKDTLQITLSQPLVLASSLSATTNYNGYNISCNGLTNAGINLSVTGGVTAYGYQWSNGSVTQNISGLGAGTYSVIITDANNCKDTSQLTLTEPAPLSSSITITSNYNGYNISCFGLSNGTLTLSVNGGVQTYTYNWSNGSSSQNLSSIGAGNYQVIVTDKNNCKDSTTVTLTQPADLNSTIVSVSNYNGYNISCAGLTNGNIDINVSGGVTSYSYTWSNSTSTQDQTNIGAGTYSVIISDANNCKDTLNLTLTQPLPLSSNAIASTDYNGYQISCNGLSNGGINLTVNGGVTVYTYQWSNGSVTQNISGVGSGTYSVIITDANNCKDTSQLTLTEPAPLSSSITITSNYNGYNISCFGLSNGTLTLSVNGGVQTYTYNWSNGSSSQNLSSIGAGNYQVIVTDKNNCKDSTTVTLTQPADLNSTIVSVSNYNGYNISCAGLTNGNIDINVSGGVTSYSYTWSNSTSTQDQTNIGAGTYSVIISDANNCKDTLNTILNEPQPLITNGNIASNYNGYSVSCFGSNDGAINVSTTGGVAAYLYQWSNGSSIQNQTNLGAGTYSVVVSDQNACSDTLQFVLNQPASINVRASIQNVLCNSFQNGSIDQTINGGVTPFTFAWSNSGNTEDLSGISGGTYSVAVTDLNGCSSTYTYTVSETSPVVVSLVHTDVICNKQQNGSVVSTVSGGTPTYTYQWSNGNTQSQLSNVGAGIYILTVTDANNCTRKDSVMIMEPTVLTGTLSSPIMSNGFNESFHTSSDGSVISTISGGTVPYAYTWSNNSSSQNLTNVPAGTYTLQVIDKNGCVFVSSITLTAPFELEMPTGISPNGDGSNDFFVVHGLEAYPDNNITIFNRWGNNIYEKDKYTNNWSGKTNSGADLPDGTYFVILKINNSDITLTGYVDIRR